MLYYSKSGWLERRRLDKYSQEEVSEVFTGAAVSPEGVVVPGQLCQQGCKLLGVQHCEAGCHSVHCAGLQGQQLDDALELGHADALLGSLKARLTLLHGPPWDQMLPPLSIQVAVLACACRAAHVSALGGYTM